MLSIFVGPEGGTIQYTDGYAGRLEKILENIADVTRYFVVAGFPHVSQGVSFAGLKDWDERNRKAQAVAAELGPKLGALPGVLAFPVAAAIPRPAAAREAGRGGDRQLVELRRARPRGRTRSSPNWRRIAA